MGALPKSFWKFKYKISAGSPLSRCMLTLKDLQKVGKTLFPLVKAMVFLPQHGLFVNMLHNSSLIILPGIDVRL